MSDEQTSAAATSHAARSTRLAVAAVGASAGGLEAITALVRALPADAPLAIVVVQHLDPLRESNLAELLTRHTPMRVETAAEGEEVRAGVVHVIPPSADLRIEDGHLRLVPRSAAPAPHLPIDDFFVSLARERGSAAMGVVLSGTGADGAEGVRALREVNGATFAQDRSAQHSGMPEAAVATDCVDAVLPPERIAKQLVERAHELALGDATTLTDGDALAHIFALLRRRSGIDFSSYKPSTLERRILRRASLRRHQSVRDYVDALRDDPAEVDALAADMLIHVTSFFRDPDVFQALTTEVFPRLLAGKAPGEATRLWVAGCSTGEEVYSLVIALTEYVTDAGLEIPIKVFGTDISEPAIQRARAGRYPDSVAEQISASRLRRFFSQRERGYQIRQEIRDLCVFARQDITRDPPFSNVDLISCRNLMIYLAAPVQRRVIPIFHYALRPGGVLLLGASESPGGFDGFEPLDARHHLYRRNTRGPRLELGLVDRPRWPIMSTPSTSATGSHVEVQREADRAVLAEYAPPGVVVSDTLAIVQFRGQTGPYLAPIPGAASLDLLKLAREELRMDLRAAIERARATSAPVRHVGMHVGGGESERQIDLEVIPLLPPAVVERHFIVLFRDQPALPTAVEPTSPPDGDLERAQRANEDAVRQELGATRTYLQAIIEQLEASNEELRAANEEIISSNEELQTAKEELQSTNEELSTVNDDMAERNLEAQRVNDDLSNVLSSAGIAILLLSRDSCIRRFTPEGARLLNLLATDVGRPISTIGSPLLAPDLVATLRDVLEHLIPREQTIADEAGRWYQLAVRPYVTADKKIDGTVVSIIDIDTVRRVQMQLAEARDYAECIVDTVKEPLVVLDEQRRVRSANPAFYAVFQLEPAAIVGRSLEQLDDAPWEIPALQSALDLLALGETIEDQRIEVHSPKLGERTMVLSGRPMAQREGRPRSVLLAFDDATEKMKSDALVRRSEKAMRDMLSAASESILIARADGAITFANAMAARTFGYTLEEFVGLSVDALVPEHARHAHSVHRAAFHEHVGGKHMAPTGERAARRKDGSLFPVDVTLSTMQGEQGPLGVAFISDVTERKQNEARIRAYERKLQETAFEAAAAEERARRRIAAGLHDNIGQTLALAQIRLSSAQAAAGVGAHPDLVEGLRLIGQAITDTRSLTFELSPPVLYDLGLPAAVSWLGDQLESKHSMQVSVASDDPLATLDDETAALLFRAVRELLTNVVKHADTPAASVDMRRHDNELSVVVEDHGAGFDPGALRPYDTDSGFGLFSVSEQIRRLGGSVDVASRPGEGTKVTLRVLVDGRKSDPTPEGTP